LEKMMRPFLLVALLLLAFSCGLFGKKQTPPPLPPEWRYEKNAVIFHLKADPNSNLYEGISHTLVVCFYQFTDPNAYIQLRGNPDGLLKLLECGRFDGSVAQSKRIVVHPGQELTESFDRGEGVKYVGIVAGYYNLQEEKILRFFAIPVVEDKSPAGVALKPARFYKDIYLGPLEIQDLRGK
jgi:predicted component of type VI protein secretion system